MCDNVNTLVVDVVGLIDRINTCKEGVADLKKAMSILERVVTNNERYIRNQVSSLQKIETAIKELGERLAKLENKRW